MDRDELDDLLSLDLVAAFFMNAGSFFIAGSAWLGIEKFVEKVPGQQLPILFWVCVVSFILGCFLVGVGFFHFRMRRGKIRRIFSQTTVVGTSAAPQNYVKAG